jgi:dTDP-4-amino-4,6-dideoxygalactose transaminase
VCRDAAMKTEIDQLKNFGFTTEIDVARPGINGKMSEFNAAIGLLQLKGLADAIARRGRVDARYREGLSAVRGIRCLPLGREREHNHSYFPIVVEKSYPTDRDGLYRKLREKNIFSRRYFYPLISDFPMYRDLPSAAPANVPHARALAETILCLPMSSNLTDADVDRVIAGIAS